jgi:hypothetical protein
MHVQVRSARNLISLAAAAAARPKNPAGSIIRAVYFGGSVTGAGFDWMRIRHGARQDENRKSSLIAITRSILEAMRQARGKR